MGYAMVTISCQVCIPLGAPHARPPARTHTHAHTHSAIHQHRDILAGNIGDVKGHAANCNWSSQIVSHAQDLGLLAPFDAAGILAAYANAAAYLLRHGWQQASASG